MTSDQWIFLQLTIPDEDVKPDLPRKQVIDVSPVLEWLNNLGLSRYNEAFIKEEIDWDTLKWLTEEVCFLTSLIFTSALAIMHIMCQILELCSLHVV